MKKQSLVGGVAILSICGLLSKLLSLIYIPALKGILGQEGHGLYIPTYQVFGFLYTICNSGLPNSISKLVSEELVLGNKRRAHRIFELSRMILVLLGIFLGLFTFFYSTQIEQWINYPGIGLPLKVLSPALVVTAVLSSYKGYFQAQGIMTPTGVSQIIEQVVNLIISLIGAAVLLKSGDLILGVTGATTGTTVGAMAAILVMMVYYKKQQNSRMISRKGEDVELIKKIIKSAAPITLCATLQNMGFLLDPLQLSTSLEAIGKVKSEIRIFTAMVGQYTSIINVPIAIAMAMAMATLPVISAKIALNDIEEARHKANFVHKLCFVVAMPCAVGLSVLAPQIMSMFGYPDGTAVIMRYGSFILILMSLIQVQTAIMQGINKLYIITVISILGLAARILINNFTIAKFGYLGVLFGNGTGFLIIVVLSMITINKAMRGRVHVFRNGIKPLIASSVMGVIVAVLAKWCMTIMMGLNVRVMSIISIILCVFIGAVVYSTVLLAIGTLSAKEMNALPAKIRRIIPKARQNK